MSVFIDKCFEQMSQGEIIVAYKGGIGADIIANTLSLVESKIEESSLQSGTRKKLYNVLVESLQNLFHHVDAPIDYRTEEANFGVFVVSRSDSGFRISTGNFIKKERVSLLKQKIDKINSLSVEELKEFYKFVLNNQKFSEKGGGGLGLIDMARKTGNKLDYKFFDYNKEFDFFNLSLIIND